MRMRQVPGLERFTAALIIDAGEGVVEAAGEGLNGLMERWPQAAGREFSLEYLLAVVLCSMAREVLARIGATCRRRSFQRV